MIVSTADNVPGKSFEILGLVRGNIVTSKNIGRDMMASVKSVVGGEIKSYTEMTDEARQVAEDRMIEQAQRLGADAILAMRFDSGSIQPGTIEMIAYGTAVKFNWLATHIYVLTTPHPLKRQGVRGLFVSVHRNPTLL